MDDCQKFANVVRPIRERANVEDFFLQFGVQVERDGVFAGEPDTLTTKCPSKFTAAEDNANDG